MDFDLFISIIYFHILYIVNIQNLLFMIKNPFIYLLYKIMDNYDTMDLFNFIAHKLSYLHLLKGLLLIKACYLFHSI